MSKNVIELHNIKRDFQVGGETVHALRGISFNICEGEFVTIMGSSGSGKSTLLNMLGGLDTPTEGSIRVGDTELAKLNSEQATIFRRKQIGFIFQNYKLFFTRA